MYKLLLVSDREEILDAFDQIHNWEFNGFKKPHIRHDFEGAKQSLKIHHADGIAMAIPQEEEERLMEYLQINYPLLPIFEPGKTPEEALEYLGELNALLNRVRADFSSDTFDEQEMMIRARRHFFRKLVGDGQLTCEQLRRGMRLRRSRMDPDRTCVLMTLEHAPMEPGWQDPDHVLERSLFQSFGGDVEGYHVLPLVTRGGDVYVLAGRLRGSEETDPAGGPAALLDSCVRKGIQHAEEYQGLRLSVTGVEVLPSLYALCTDYRG